MSSLNNHIDNAKAQQTDAGASSQEFHLPVVLTGLPSLRATLLTLKL
jgi:hypothetical protein